MPEGSTLTVRVKHQLGGFSLDVDFTADRWPALLFGPSGAGKSTVLRILAGLEKPQAAHVTLGSQVLVDTDLRIEQRPGSGGVQLVTQRAALFPHLSVRENVAFGLRRQDHARRNSVVDEMLALFHADKLTDRRVTRLSGGERQRVALARALACRPRMLLLDEAFTGLDGSLKADILADLTSILEQQQVLALHVTHELSDAYALNALVIRMHDGGITAAGPAAEILAEDRLRLLHLLR